MASRKKKPTVAYMTGVSIRANYTVLYSMRADGLPMSRGSSRPIKNQPDGVLSGRAIKRIRNAVNWLTICSDYKRVYSKKENKTFGFLLNFITLTLSEKQKHSDQYVKKHMLNPFLDWLHRSHGVNAYLWKAEAQKETGNIHFHITTNVFIHWKSIRKKWNEIQYRNGYEKAFTDGNVNGKNSTDVHAVKKMQSIGSYIAKYFVKNQNDRRKIDGKLWGASSNLSKLKINLCPHDVSFDETMQEYQFRNEFTFYKADFAEVFTHDPLSKMKLPPLIKERLAEIKTKINGGDSIKTFYEVDTFF